MSFTRTGLGYSMVITNAIIGLYYNVIIAWAAYFLLTSVTSYLPWTDCNNSWNTPHCVQYINTNGNISASPFS